MLPSDVDLQSLLCSALPDEARARLLDVPGVGGATSPLDWLEANTVWRFRVSALERSRVLEGVLEAGRATRQRFLLPAKEVERVIGGLEARGFRSMGEFRRLDLALEPSTAAPPGQAGGPLPVREARTPAEVEAWFEVRRAAGADPGAPAEALVAAVGAMVGASAPTIRLFYAHDGSGRGLAAGGLRLFPQVGAAYLWGGCARPDPRPRGAYRATILARVQAARAEGLSTVHAVASPTSAPILEALGMRGGEAWAYWVREAQDDEPSGGPPSGETA